MALDAIKSTVNIPAVPKVDTTTGYDTGAANINVSEVQVVAVTPGNNNQTGGQKENPASEKQIRAAISKANNTLRTHRTSCEFSYDETTKSVSIKILDDETSEVIKEIPPEETLQMIAKMWELAGLLVDEKR